MAPTVREEDKLKSSAWDGKQASYACVLGMGVCFGLLASGAMSAWDALAACVAAVSCPRCKQA
jgi:hypothetical protein